MGSVILLLSISSRAQRREVSFSFCKHDCLWPEEASIMSSAYQTLLPCAWEVPDWLRWSLKHNKR